ncbi:hypothetical protein H1R20_g7785, partial [Candolleomyces eurysporus]
MSTLPRDDALATAPSDYIITDPGPPATPLRLPPVKEVLSNYTLLNRIFSNIIPLDDRDADGATIAEGRKRLLAIARVSVAFRDPALDCLWKCLGSLIPLILLIDSVHLVDGVYTVSNIHIHGDQLKPSFFKYAERVRTLEISQRMAIVGKDAPIDPSIQLLLSQQLGGTPLLPRLELIILSSPITSSSIALPLLILLPCSSLSAVEVQGPILETAWCHKVFLPTLASRASSSLKHLALKHDKAGLSGGGPWATLGLFKELRTLSLHSPESHFFGVTPFRDLGSLLNGLIHLQNLTLHLPGPDSASRIPASSLRHLSLLEELNMVGWMQEQSRASQLLVPAVVRSLVSLTLTFSQPGTWSTLEEVGRTLLSTRTLKRVTLQSNQSSTGILGSAILNFFKAVRLEDVTINIERLEETDDSFFGKLLDTVGGFQLHASQHLLRSLVLPPGWTGKPPDLSSLTQIAQKAPTLQRIGIPIHSELHPPILQHITKLISSGPLGPERSNLVHLELCDTRDPEKSSHISLHQYQIIAQYIDMLFPRLVSISLHPNSKCRDFWPWIEQLRLMYREMRLKLSSRVPGS